MTQTSDLVDRLRQQVGDAWAYDPTFGLRHEAAFEISRLRERAEVAERERDALKAENERLREALRRAREHVLSQNRAEGMMDGFGGQKPRPSDDDLAAVDAAPNHEGERG